MEEKQLILGLDEKLATTIYNAYNTSSIRSFADLESKLTSKQTDLLIEKFKNINQFQLNYLRKPRDEREGIINAIKNMGLDLDNDSLLLTTSS